MLTTRFSLRYKQHIIRQAHDIALFMRDENLVIDESIDYDVLPGMSHEVRQRLKDARPTTLVSLVFLPTRSTMRGHVHGPDSGRSFHRAKRSVSKV